MIDLSCIIPAYNEESNVGEMIGDVRRAMNALGCTYEIIAVDDGSLDGTSEIINRFVADGDVRLLRHNVNEGYGSAVLTGLTNAKLDYVFFTDSDRQFDLAELKTFIEAIENADLVMGYRAPRRDPFMRKLNGWGWSLIVSMLFGYTGRDIDCAFKLMRREVVETLAGKIQSHGATFSAEFLILAKRTGFRIKELPVRGHRPRVAGNPTGANPAVILRAFGELFKFRLRLLREGQSTEKARIQSSSVKS